MQILPIVPFDFYLGKNNIITVFAVSAYKDPLRSLILAKHTGNETYIRFLANFIVAQPMIDHLDFDCITFIPLHWTRYASRGFNQAEIIAQALSERTGKPVLPLITRSKKTQYQARLSLQQREHNVRDAFSVNEKYSRIIAGKKILIVDDLFTTGSTIKAAAHILLPLQPAKIDVFVACRVVST
ncbi:MAG: phosphoribosyltransferase family protein [Candidatus Chromulinivorax sp.]|nr:phosphoribosyltransferase family protein [Candidatus Chromulinivorax sp.]